MKILKIRKKEKRKYNNTDSSPFPPTIRPAWGFGMTRSGGAPLPFDIQILVIPNHVGEDKGGSGEESHGCILQAYYVIGNEVKNLLFFTQGK